MRGSLPILWGGMIVTMQITLVGATVGIWLGMVLAVLRLSRSRILSWLAAAYVTVFRSIPLVMVLFWFHLILIPLAAGLLFPGQRLALSLLTALTAFSLFEASYYAGIIPARSMRA